MPPVVASAPIRPPDAGVAASPAGGHAEERRQDEDGGEVDQAGGEATEILSFPMNVEFQRNYVVK